MIELRNLWVRYPNRDKFILRGVNLEISTDGIYLIVGKTGCGKTTLARVLVGLIPHIFYAEVSGEVRVLGEDPIKNGPGTLAGKVAYVSQNPELFISSITVEEELYLPLINLGLKPESMKRRVEYVVKTLKLGDLINRSTLELSSGQLQLIALASAIATGAKVLVLDEPLSRLDPDNYIRFIKALSEVSTGRIILVFEHHLDYLVELANEIIVLKDGTVAAQGSLDDVAELLLDINIPELLEYAVIFRGRGCIDRIPKSLNEFLVMIENAIKHKECVV